MRYRENMPRRQALFLLVLALTSVACKTPAPRVEPLRAAPPPPPAINREGQVGFEVVADLPALVPHLESDQEYRPAYALPTNPLPVYPAELLPHNLPPQEVVVRVIIDSEGNVARFEESPVPSKVDPSYRSDFVRAIEETVRAWTFEPAHIREFGPASDDDADGQPDFLILRKHTSLTSYHDLRFIFEVKDGRGVVTGGT